MGAQREQGGGEGEGGGKRKGGKQREKWKRGQGRSHVGKGGCDYHGGRVNIVFKY